jgi:hypothetical protein
MTRVEQVIENAMAVVAASRAAREQDADRRAKTFGRIEVGASLKAYQSKLPPKQLTLKLDS